MKFLLTYEYDNGFGDCRILKHELESANLETATDYAKYLLHETSKNYYGTTQTIISIVPINDELNQVSQALKQYNDYMELKDSTFYVDVINENNKVQLPFSITSNQICLCVRNNVISTLPRGTYETINDVLKVIGG